MCDVQLHEGTNGIVSVSSGIFSQALMLRVPTLEECHLTQAVSNGSKLKNSIISIINHFQRSEQENKSLSISSKPTTNFEQFQTGSCRQQQRRIFVQLDDVLYQFLDFILNYGIHHILDSPCDINIEDWQVLRDQIVSTTVEVVAHFLHFVHALPIIYSSSTASDSTINLNDHTGEKYLSSEESIYILTHLWKIQHHLRKVMQCVISKQQQSIVTIDYRIASPPSTPSKHQTHNTSPSQSSPSKSPIKTTSALNQRDILHKHLNEIIEAIDHYSSQSCDSLACWMDIILASNLLKQDWSSTSPYLRNRKVTPGLVLISSFLELVQSRFERCCCNVSVNDEVLVNKSRAYFDKDQTMQKEEKENQSENKILENNAVIKPEIEDQEKASGILEDTNDQVISLLPSDEVPNNNKPVVMSPTKDTITILKNGEMKAESSNSDKFKDIISMAEKDFYFQLIGNKSKAFVFSLIESLCRSVFQHYGIIPTELGDMLNASLSRVRLQQWQVDITFIWKELDKIVRQTNYMTGGNLCDASIIQQLSCLRTFLSLMETTLFISRSNCEDVVSLVKDIMLLKSVKDEDHENIREDASDGSDGLRLYSTHQECCNSRLEGYCCSMNYGKRLSLLATMLEDTDSARTDKKCLMDEIKGINEHATINLDIDDLRDAMTKEHNCENIRLGWILLALRNVYILKMFESSNVSTPDNVPNLIHQIYKKMEITIPGDNKSVNCILPHWIEYILNCFRFEMIDASYPLLNDAQKVHENQMKELLVAIRPAMV
jgi:hypothetical protein